MIRKKILLISFFISVPLFGMDSKPSKMEIINARTARRAAKRQETMDNNKDKLVSLADENKEKETIHLMFDVFTKDPLEFSLQRGETFEDELAMVILLHVLPALRKNILINN